MPTFGLNPLAFLGLGEENYQTPGSTVEPITPDYSSPEQEEYPMPGSTVDPIRPVQMPDWQFRMADKMAGEQYGDDPDSAKKDALHAAMREFGKYLLAAGMAPDYRGVGKALAGGLSNFGDTFRGSMQQSREQQEHKDEINMKKKIFDVNYESAEINLREARRDEGVKAAMRKAAEDSVKDFDVMWDGIINDEDIMRDPGKRKSYESAYRFYRDAYRMTGTLESGAKLMELIRDAGDTAGQSEKTDKLLFDSLRAAAAPIYGTGPEAVQKFVEDNRKKAGFQIDQEWLENQLRRMQIEGQGIQNQIGQASLAMIQSGAGAPPGYMVVPGGRGGIRYIKDPNFVGPQELDIDQARLGALITSTLGEGLPITLENINQSEELKQLLQTYTSTLGLTFDDSGNLTPQGYSILSNVLIGINPNARQATPGNPFGGIQSGSGTTAPQAPPRVGTPEAEARINQMMNAAASQGRPITKEQAIQALLRNNKISQ